MTAMVEIPRETPRTIDDERDSDFQLLCRDLKLVSAAMPDGYRVEIVGGSIVMSPWSKGQYNDILDSLLDQLSPHVPPGHRARTTPNLYTFPQFDDAFGPDLHVSDKAATRVDSIFLPGSALSLVAEQTSTSTRHRDLGEKADVYGKAEVPVYVLIDMLQGTVTVFDDPTPDLGYRRHAQIKFGETVRIPSPFDCELDTADWQA
ncbi:Uma2 family endonuclease [Streptomyces syringium]|uniref:Uma2 family endonuclease n=1 Tax=Streptomyces syringium TaxID=76729 RepID=UPI0034450E41